MGARSSRNSARAHDLAFSALRLGVLYDLLGRFHHHDMRDATVGAVCSAIRSIVGGTGARQRRFPSSNNSRLATSPEAEADNQLPECWNGQARLHEIGIRRTQRLPQARRLYPDLCRHARFSKKDQARLALLVFPRGKLEKITEFRRATAELGIRSLRLRLSAVAPFRATACRCAVCRSVAASEAKFRHRTAVRLAGSHPLSAVALNEESASWARVGKYGLRVKPAQPRAAAADMGPAGCDSRSRCRGRTADRLPDRQTGRWYSAGDRWRKIPSRPRSANFCVRRRLDGVARIWRIDGAGAVPLWRGWNGVPRPMCAFRMAQLRPGTSWNDRLPGGSPAGAGRPHDSRWNGSAKVLGLRHFAMIMTLIGRLLLDIGWLLWHPRNAVEASFRRRCTRRARWHRRLRHWSAFLIGVSYCPTCLSLQKLRLFGAETFIVNILGMSIIVNWARCWSRSWWPAARGPAMTAQIGVMRVTEEIDALATMGVSRTLRLVLPKVMPHWQLQCRCSPCGAGGGHSAAWFPRTCSLSWGFFIETLPRWCHLPNVWIQGFERFLSSACSSVSSPAISAARQAQYRKPVDEDNSVRW